MADIYTSAESIRACLERLPLFSATSPELLDPLVQATRTRRITRGTRIFQRGDPPRGFYCVVFGQVKLAFSSAQGSEKVIEIIGPQQSFGEAVMFMDRPYPVFAEALCDTLLLQVSQEAVFQLLEQSPAFARQMLAGLSMRLHTLVNDVESYSLHTATQRVIGYLLQLASQGINQQRLELPTSKQTIASRLNLTPETLSRVFNELTRAGLILVEGRFIDILDLQGLAAQP